MGNIFGIVHLPSPYHCGPEIHERNLTSLMGLYGQAHWSMSQNLTYTVVPRVLTQWEVSPKRAFIAHEVSISASEIRFYCDLGGEVRLNIALGFRTAGHFSCRVISVDMYFLPCMTLSRELAVSAQFLSMSAPIDSREEALSGGVCSQSQPVFVTL